MTMADAVAELDGRFSDPSAVATPWDETRRVIVKAALFWISTVRPGGPPNVTPLPAVWRTRQPGRLTNRGRRFRILEDS